MSVKVRCPGCEKVLSAPDAARGKAVKCPQCQTKIKVPAAKAAVKERKKVAAIEEDDNFLANLDLSKAEDRSVKLCPRCGAEVEQEDFECPSCGINLQTGSLSEKTVRKRKRKGPDPALFYREVWGDSWQFMKTNSGLAVRSTIYWTLMILLAVGCFSAASYIHGRWGKPPVVVFMSALGILFTIAIPGWLWFLWQEVIQGTMEKKTKLKRVNFDIFLVMALGIKAVLWTVVNGLQFGIVGLIVVIPAMMSSQMAGTIAANLVGLASWVVFPVVMAHMAMPIQWKAWAAWVSGRLVVKNIKPVMYWWMMWFACMVVTGAAMAGLGFLVGTYAATVVETLGLAIEKNLIPGAPREMSKVAVYVVAGSIGLLAIVNLALTAFSYIFLMRANGLLTFYFKRDLELVAQEKAIKYVPKEITGADETDEMTWGQVAMVYSILMVMAIVGGVIYSMVGSDVPMAAGIGWGLGVMAYLIALSGRLTFLGAAFQESALWGIGCIVVPLCDLAYLIMYWQDAKKGFFVQLSAIPFLMISIAMVGMAIITG